MDSNPNYLNQEDFNKVLAEIPRLKIRKWKDKDIEFLLKILYHMALRPSEGIRLKKEDFDIKNRLVYLGKTKTSTSDRAVIPRVFVAELEQYLISKNEGALFPNLTYGTFYKWLKKLGLMLNIEAWLPNNRIRMKENTVGHLFRKSIGKDLMDAGIEIDIISKHLRHSKPSMTIDHYLKADIKKVHDTL